MKLQDLRPNKHNPRKISAKQKDALKKSLHEFGDLGSVVFNEQTGNLVGGHQRKEALAGATIKVLNKYDPPTRTGTVADGVIMIDGENFSYRAVRWDAEREIAALLSANKNQGSWDKDLLKMTFHDFPKLNLTLTGFEMPELKIMGIDLTPQTDEQYVASTPETTEQIPTANPNENVNFGSTNEETKVVGKRFVIIVDCPNQETKDILRDKLKPEIEASGSKIF